MSGNQHLVETLLRPPVELFAATSYGLIALLMAVAPSYFMLTPSVAYFCAFILLYFAIRRFIQGFKIVRYHFGLKRMSPYVMRDKDIPVSNIKLFLGMGFLWDQRHAQRIVKMVESIKSNPNSINGQGRSNYPMKRIACLYSTCWSIEN